MKVKTIYIAGPFTHNDDAVIEANILAAEDVARAIITLTKGNVACIVPHSLGRNFKRGPGDADYWYRATEEMCSRCDAVVLVPGWENSAGTLREIALMISLGKPVYHSILAFLLGRPVNP